MPAGDDDDYLPPPIGGDDGVMDGPGVSPRPARPTEPLPAPTTALVLTAVVAAGLGALAHWAVSTSLEPPPTAPESPRPDGAVVPQPAPAGLVRRADGAQLVLAPGDDVRLVNVFLEGCADCQPAVDAWVRFRREGKIPPLPQLNVAYVRVTPKWAEENLLDENLVVDDGASIVRPLGLHRFTTLLVAADGTECFRASPDAPRYLEKLTAAVARCREVAPKGLSF